MSSSFLSQPILLTASEASVLGCSAERKKEGKRVWGVGGNRRSLGVVMWRCECVGILNGQLLSPWSQGGWQWLTLPQTSNAKSITSWNYSQMNKSVSVIMCLFTDSRMHFVYHSLSVHFTKYLKCDFDFSHINLIRVSYVAVENLF